MTISLWLNVYPAGVTSAFNSEEVARSCADPGALRVAVHLREVVPEGANYAQLYGMLCEAVDHAGFEISMDQSKGVLNLLPKVEAGAVMMADSHYSKAVDVELMRMIGDSNEGLSQRYRDTYINPLYPRPQFPDAAAKSLADIRPRIVAAIKRITSGHGCMRIPAEPNDPDLVLSDILNIIDGRKQNPIREEDDGYGSDFATAS